MPGSRDLIQKPRMMREFEKQSRRIKWAESPELSAAIQLLEDTELDDVAALEVLARVHMSDDLIDHFLQDWLGQPDGHGYWRQDIGAAAVIRRGMLEVCKCYQGACKRSTVKFTNYLWVISCVRSGSIFEISIAECDDHIDVFFHTPEPDYSTHPRQPCDSRSMQVVEDVGNCVIVRQVIVPAEG